MFGSSMFECLIREDPNDLEHRFRLGRKPHFTATRAFKIVCY